MYVLYPQQMLKISNLLVFSSQTVLVSREFVNNFLPFSRSICGNQTFSCIVSYKKYFDGDNMYVIVEASSSWMGREYMHHM